jgi:hypothetical protein
MKKIYLLFILLSTTVYANAQYLVSKTLIGSYTKPQLDSILNEIGVPSFLATTKYGVDAYKILYNTVNPDTSAAVASGLMVVPKGVSCEFPLVSYGHGTTSKKEDVPSRLNGEGIVGLVVGSNGMVMAEPDFLGMGDGTWPHHYLHAYTQARSCIDLMRAVREACAQLNVSLDDSLVFLSGYSQGGFSAMATHKYIQENLSNEFHIAKSFPGAGSYDMSGAMVDLMLSDSTYPSPGYLPFLICTWNPIYHFYTNPSEYFKAPYDVTLPALVDGLHSIGDINDSMPQIPKLIFKQELIDSFAANPNHPLRIALRENDIYQWVPQAPVLLVHCQADRQVPIQNTRNAYNYFKQHGALRVDTIDPSPASGHGDCGDPYFLILKNQLNQTLASINCLTGIENNQNNNDIELFPNPTHEFFTLKWNPFIQISEVTITDASGKVLVKKTNLSGNNYETFEVSLWPKGVYLLQCSTQAGVQVRRLMVD